MAHVRRRVRYLAADENLARFKLLDAMSALDAALASGMSRASAKAAFGACALLCQRRPLSGTDWLAAGTELDVILHAGEHGNGARTAEALPPSFADSLNVVFEDPFLIIVNKPQGIIVHGDGTGRLTLTDLVQKRLRSSGSPACPQALQRLDRDTTGLVCFSKTAAFQPAFDQLIASGGLRKRYLAVVWGHIRDATHVTASIGRDRHDARRMRVSASGKPASTTIVPVAERDGRTLVIAELGSGRRHQIRVHLASLGHPVVGDELYGRPSNRTAGKPQPGREPASLMLHAWRLDFAHPVTAEQVEAAAPFPPRFCNLGFSPENLARIR